MGSFSATCAVSGMPIEYGDDIRILLLAQTPYEDNRPCYMHDVWYPRTFPLRGKYDDYGSAEGIEEGPARDVWLEGFRLDLVPSGWGDNTVHDVPTSKDMSWDDMLVALWEDRVYVQAEWHGDLMLEDLEKAVDAGVKALGMERAVERKRERRKIPVGVPTRRRVEKRIAKAGFPLFGGNWAAGGFLTNTVRKGVVRVRVQSYEKDSWGKDAEYLAKLQPALREYATVIAKGSGAYANAADMLVLPKPGVEWYPGIKGGRRSSLVNVAMIREDVWQSLLQIDAPTWSGGKRLSFAHMQKEMKEYERQYEEHMNTEPRLTVPFGALARDSRIGHFVGRDVIPFTVGLGTHWHLMRRKGPLPPSFVQTAAEFAHIHSVLSATRYYWRPGYTVGPQFGEWRAHEKVFKAFTQIAKTSAKRVEAESKE